MRRNERIPLHAHTGSDDGGVLGTAALEPTVLGGVTSAPSVSLSLDGLNDVNAPTPANGDVLTWDSTPGEWVPAAPSGSDPSWVIDANASPYSCVPDDATDATAGLQAAIDAAVTAAGTAGSGVAVVELDAGVYEISGALQTTGNYYAQIMLPTVAVTASKLLLVIRAKHVHGQTYPNGSQTTAQAGVVVLHSTLTGQTYSATHGTPSIMGGPDPEKTSTFSNIQLHLQSIAFRQPANPSMCCLNAQLLHQCIVEDCRFDTEDASEASYTQPTNVTGIACLMPINNNNAMADYRGTVRAAGYYAGIGISEHTQADKVLAYQCYVGLNIQGDYYHGAQIDHASVELCYHVIATVEPASGIVNPSGASGYSVFNIDMLDIEDAASGWADPVYHINDPGNDYHGRVRYVRVLAGVGTQTGALTNNGATNLGQDDLTDLPAVGEPTADAHIADTSDAHDASAISVADAGGYFTATDVEAALQELAADVAAVAGHYEVLMASGSADPLETSDGLDWLYVWVAD